MINHQEHVWNGKCQWCAISYVANLNCYKSRRANYQILVAQFGRNHHRVVACRIFFHFPAFFGNVSWTLKDCQEPSWTLVFINLNLNSHYSNGLSGKHKDFQGLLWNAVIPYHTDPQLLRPSDRDAKVQERPCHSTLWGLEHSREFSGEQMVREEWSNWTKRRRRICFSNCLLIRVALQCVRIIVPTIS